MDSKKKAAIMSLLQEKIKAIGTEVQLRELENGYLSLSFLTSMRDDGSGFVFFELGMIDYEDFTLFQIVVTILPRIGKQLPELEKTIAHWNLTSLIGAYGIYYPQDQMYYKNRFLLVDSLDPEDLVPLIMNYLYVAYDEIEDKYETAVQICQGN